MEESPQYIFHVPKDSDPDGLGWLAILGHVMENNLDVAECVYYQALYIFDNETMVSIRQFALDCDIHFAVYMRL